jgi:FkbM family methyltransferase
MDFLNLVLSVLQHPLNKGGRVRGLFRFFYWQLISRIYKGDYKIPFVNKTFLYVRGGMTGATGNIYFGLSDYREMSFLLDFLMKDDVFFDIGANIGSYSVLASGVVGAKSIAIEPIPETFSFLLSNISLNLLNKRVNCFNLGATDNGCILSFTNNLGTMNHVIQDEYSVPHINKVDVEAKRIDDILPCEEVTIMKIDVEGYEYKVLNGATKRLANEKLLAIIIEINGNHLRYMFNNIEIHNLLISFGFCLVDYSPLLRQINRIDLVQSKTDNLIYVRSPDEVNKRLNIKKNFYICNVNKSIFC